MCVFNNWWLKNLETVNTPVEIRASGAWILVAMQHSPRKETGFLEESADSSSKRERETDRGGEKLFQNSKLERNKGYRLCYAFFYLKNVL